MPSAWAPNGPISLPPRSLAFGVGGALVLLAFAGVGMGLKAAWKDTGVPDLGGAVASGADSADTLTAKPIVELAPPPTAANTADNAAADDASASNSSDDIEQRTAEAQQVQSTASKSGGDIDKILASPTEKPTAPAKPTTIEAPPPPGPPVKSDVPF